MTNCALMLAGYTDLRWSRYYKGRFVHAKYSPRGPSQVKGNYLSKRQLTLNHQVGVLVECLDHRRTVGNSFGATTNLVEAF